jgi:hypothetical protein
MCVCACGYDSFVGLYTLKIINSDGKSSTELEDIFLYTDDASILSAYEHNQSGSDQKEIDMNTPSSSSLTHSPLSSFTPLHLSFHDNNDNQTEDDENLISKHQEELLFFNNNNNNTNRFIKSSLITPDFERSQSTYHSEHNQQTDIPSIPVRKWGK